MPLKLITGGAARRGAWPGAGGGGGVIGGGTPTYLAAWIAANQIGDSIIWNNAQGAVIGDTAAAAGDLWRLVRSSERKPIYY